jgi:hypothetical protein
LGVVFHLCEQGVSGFCICGLVTGGSPVLIGSDVTSELVFEIVCDFIIFGSICGCLRLGFLITLGTNDCLNLVVTGLLCIICCSGIDIRLIIYTKFLLEFPGGSSENLHIYFLVVLELLNSLHSISFGCFILSFIASFDYFS